MSNYIQERLKQAEQDGLAQAEELASGNAELWRGVLQMRALFEKPQPPPAEQPARPNSLRGAATNLTILARAAEREREDAASLDTSLYGAALLAGADTNAYEAFRQTLLARFSTATNPAVRARIYRACLLAPAGDDLLQNLAQWYQSQTLALRDASSDADDWISLGVGMLDYRRGNFARAVQEFRQALGYANAPARSLAQILLAMAHYQNQQTNQALYDLAYVGGTVEQHFRDGAQSLANTPTQPGDLRDWTAARILLREAYNLLGNPPLTNAVLAAQTEATFKRIEALRAAQRLDEAEAALEQLPPEAVILESKRADGLFTYTGWRQFVEGSRRPAAIDWTTVALGPDGLGGLSVGRELCHFYLSYAPLLVELGDQAAYEKFRQSALANFSQTLDPLKAEPVLVSCLLTAGDPTTLERLSGVADVVAHTQSTDADWTPRTGDSLALLAYRRGDYPEAVRFLQRSREASCGCPTLEARTHVLTALVCCQLHQPGRAVTELDLCRGPILTGFDQGRTAIGGDESGVWYDWWIDNLLLREADGLMGGSSRLGPNEGK